MDHTRTLRRWWWLALPIAILLAWYSGILFDRIVKERLEELGNRIAGEGYEFRIASVQPSLFRGTIIVRGITLGYDTVLMQALHAGERGELLSLRADRLELTGIGYWSLITRDEVRVVTVAVDHPEILYHFRPSETPEDEPLDEVVDEQAMSDVPSLIRVGNLRIISATGSTTDITRQRPAFNIGRLDVSAVDLHLRTYEDGRMTYDVGGADIQAWELAAELPPIYDLAVSELHVHHPSGSATIANITLVSRVDGKQYWKELEYETDLFNVQVDSISFHQIDVGRFLSDQVLHMTRLEIHSPHAVIHRDKSMPDAPFQHKSLPVSGLGDLGVSIRVDTVILRDGVVDYHERLERDSEFGVVSFSAINGTMTGVNNSAQAAAGDGELRVQASARVYESTTINMNYSAPLSSTTDAFMLQAQLGELPFTMFNRMTDDLLNVKATAGSIHKMVLRMQGNEWQGSGTLDLHYEDLHIDLKPHSTRWHEGIALNLLGNALVRKQNMPDRRNYRQGEFVVDRRQDRAIFNFLWQAVKAGSVDTMAPGVLRKQMQKAAMEGNDASNKKKERKKERKARRSQRGS